MLLDDRQVAISDLIVAYREAADHYEHALERLESGPERELFGAIHAEHEKSHASLETIIRELGELPRAPSIDREDLHELVTLVKSAISLDETRTLVEDRLLAERQLLSLVDAALEIEHPDSVKATLVELRERQDKHIDRLQAVLEAPG